MLEAGWEMPVRAFQAEKMLSVNAETRPEAGTLCTEQNEHAWQEQETRLECLRVARSQRSLWIMVDGVASLRELGDPWGYLSCRIETGRTGRAGGDWDRRCRKQLALVAVEVVRGTGRGVCL